MQINTKFSFILIFSSFFIIIIAFSLRSTSTISSISSTSSSSSSSLSSISIMSNIKLIMDTIESFTPLNYTLMDKSDTKHLLSIVGIPSDLLSKFPSNIFSTSSDSSSSSSSSDSSSSSSSSLSLSKLSPIVKWKLIDTNLKKNIQHELIFQLKYTTNNKNTIENIKNLEDLVLKISTPGNPLYGKYLTKNEINSILYHTNNEDETNEADGTNGADGANGANEANGVNEIDGYKHRIDERYLKIKNYLLNNNIKILYNDNNLIEKEKFYNNLTFKTIATIEQWENLLNTKFYYLELINNNNEENNNNIHKIDHLNHKIEHLTHKIEHLTHKIEHIDHKEDHMDHNIHHMDHNINSLHSNINNIDTIIDNYNQVIRCPYYYLSNDISNEILSISNTVQFPTRFLIIKKGPRILPRSPNLPLANQH